MPFDPFTQLSATLLIKLPGAKQDFLAAPELLIHGRDTAPGIYLPSPKTLSFTPGINTPEQDDKEWARQQRRIEVVADLGDLGKGTGEVTFQVRFGFNEPVMKCVDLAAHLYLIPAFESTLPIEHHEPVWIGGMTLPRAVDDLTSIISAHFVSEGRSRPLAFTELSPDDDERTLLLTLHRIHYPRVQEPTQVEASRSKKKRKLKTESFVPDPEHLLAGESKGIQKVKVSDGLILKGVRRVEPFKAYVCTYDDDREAPLVEFVFHCRSSNWIRSHSTVDIPSTPPSLIETDSSSWPSRTVINLVSSPDSPHTPPPIPAAIYSANPPRKNSKRARAEFDE